MPVIPASALAREASTLIDAERLHSALARAGASMDVIAVAGCDSTNALLAGLLQRDSFGRSGGAVLCVADRQTAGRGRRGRSWVSTPEGSLTFSIARDFSKGRELSGLSLAVGLALKQGLTKCGFETIRLKWPNDLLLARPASPLAKVGGILIELSSHRDVHRAVVGVGINLRQPAAGALAGGIGPGAQPAAGLDAAGAVPDRNDLLAALAGEICQAMDAFARQGFAPLCAAWDEAHAFTGHDVVLHADDGAQTVGQCLGVDADGALRVRTVAGETRWLAGDVSLRTTRAGG
jgi:BirA family biotin operon repressor/biotin-[acetyl-CoA-carboxylase] ligase